MTASLLFAEPSALNEAAIYTQLIDRVLVKSKIDTPVEQAKIVAWDERLFRLLFSEPSLDLRLAQIDQFADVPFTQLYQDIVAEISESRQISGFILRQVVWDLYRQVYLSMQQNPQVSLFPTSASDPNLRAWQSLLSEMVVQVFPDFSYAPLEISEAEESEFQDLLEFFPLSCTRLNLMVTRIELDLPLVQADIDYVTRSSISVPDQIRQVRGHEVFHLLAHYLSGHVDGRRQRALSTRERKNYSAIYGMQALAFYEQGWRLAYKARSSGLGSTLRLPPPVSGKPKSQSMKVRRSSVGRPALRLPSQRGQALRREFDLARAAPSADNDEMFDAETRQRYHKKDGDLLAAAFQSHRIEPLLSYREIKAMPQPQQLRYASRWVVQSAQGSRDAARIMHYLRVQQMENLQSGKTLAQINALSQASVPPESIARLLRWSESKARTFLSQMELRSQVVSIYCLGSESCDHELVLHTPPIVTYATPEYIEYADPFREGGNLEDPQCRQEFIDLTMLLLAQSQEVWGFELPLDISAPRD